MSKFDTKELLEKIKELEALNEKHLDTIHSYDMTQLRLKADLFNEQEHYKILKESYDRVFKFIEKEFNVTQQDAFDKFLNWMNENE